MKDTLDLALQGLGYGPRAPQRRLYDALGAHGALVAQAGTGVGKSLAVLSAAYDMAQANGIPSLVVVPTNVLLDQYAHKDGPAFSDATGATVRALKGRAHYLCPYADAWVMYEEHPRAILRAIEDPFGIFEVGQDTRDYGCPGSDGCGGVGCNYLNARAELADADVIITNAHLFVIESSFVAIRQHDDDCDGELDPKCECGPRIFPPFGKVFVDESHTLESVVRDFTSLKISAKTCSTMDEAGQAMVEWLSAFQGTSGVRVLPNHHLGAALEGLAAWKPPGEIWKGHTRRKGVVEAAKKMIEHGKAGRLSNSSSVMWVDPGERATLTAMSVSVAGMVGPMLMRQPFALVSATIPRTMTGNLGVKGVTFLDVGHPFDYSIQGSIEISPLPGDYRSNQVNLGARADELLERILASKGGALVLFSSYRNLEAVYERIGPKLRRAGIKTLRQERDVDKRALGDAFKKDGNAVLFGTKSFATGFDAPGEALRLLAVWSLPYPGKSPLVDAIRQRSWESYEDMMLVEVTQSIGRLIRSESDTGKVWLGDSRAQVIMGRSDPLLSHLNEFQRS